MKAHLVFQTAMRETVQSMLAVYSGNRLINALMNDRARALFTQVALYLQLAGRADGKPGLSARKDMCAEAGLCSRRRCEAILTLMRAAGFLAAAPNDDKRR